MDSTGYIKREDRKKILLISDDIRLQSGVATVAREIVVGTSNKYNWVNLAAAINHPDKGKKLDLSQDTNNIMSINDASIFLYPIDGYGTPDIVRQMIELEKPDAVMIITDPRYFVLLFQMEHEIRKSAPLIYLSIWDNYPAPLYNKSFYESCDALFGISKQSKLVSELVLEEKAKDKVIKYVPHGINEKYFYPINNFMKEDSEKLKLMKNKLFGKKEYDFVLLYNARNIRRKCVSDLIVAWSVFCDKIGSEKANKCCLLLHTQKLDENGTDLPAVIDLTCSEDYKHVIFSEDRLSTGDMNLLYNLSDACALVSSNEGWGLSLTEAMMTGKMIIANVTGGMIDQMRFEDEKGNWLEYSKDFPSNHFGTYKNHGVWAEPVYPSNFSLVGSIPTPYIWDDRADFRDIAKAIENVYSLDAEERAARGFKARKWVTSDEAMMTSRKMCENIVDGIDETISKFKPRHKFELIKVTPLKKKSIKHKLIY